MVEGDGVGRVHDDGENMGLADAQRDEEMVWVGLGDDPGPEDLRSEVVGVGGDVREQALEGGSGGSGNEGGSAPVVKDRTQKLFAAGRGYLFHVERSIV